MNQAIVKSKGNARGKKNSLPMVEKNDYGFKVSPKYKIIRLLGNGAFAEVCSAKNMETGEKVAIKKIFDIWSTDPKHILREIKLLQHMKHENIIELKELIVPPNENFNEIYLVLELMSSDLAKVTNSGVPLTLDHLKTFTYQIFRGLKYIHSMGVVHRDLKPSNILVNEKCDLKIADFGTGRKLSVHLTLMESVTTRWYIAPEGLFSSSNYDKAVDIWSVGCIFGELIGGRPLFQGKENLEQVRVIVDVLGTPTAEDFEAMGNPGLKNFILKELPSKTKIPFSELFQDADPLAIDLLDKMLVYNPKKRITVEQALEHPFLGELHDPEDEPTCTTVFADLQELQNKTLKTEEYKALLLAEIKKYSKKEEN